MDTDALGEVGLETLMSKTNLSVAACDGSGHVTFMSPTLQEMFGRVDGLHLSEIVERLDLHDDSGTVRLRAQDLPLTRALRGEVIKDALITARLDGTHLMSMRCNAAPQIGSDGQILGAVVLVQDVTAELTARLEQEVLRNRLVMTVNHAFRTPLTKLLGHAELLHESDDPLAARRSLDMVWQSANELAGLMRTISDLIDLEAHTNLSKTYSDVAGLIRGIADDFGTCPRGVRLVTETPRSLAAILDPPKTRKAIVELLNNAATYSPGDAEIRLRLVSDRTTFKISVCDSGAGVRPSDRERLMEPFERGADSGQPVHSKGLGLAIARTVAVAHGGDLTLSDRAPHGLCATLVFPRDGTAHQFPA